MVWQAKTTRFWLYIFGSCCIATSSSTRRVDIKQCREWTEQSWLLGCGCRCCGCWDCGCSSPGCHRGCPTYCSCSASICWQINGRSGSNQDSNSIPRIPGMSLRNFIKSHLVWLSLWLWYLKVCINAFWLMITWCSKIFRLEGHCVL